MEIDRKLSITYSNNEPILPSVFIQEFGKKLLDLTYVIFNKHNQNEYHVSLGYYVKDIKTCIRKYQVAGNMLEIVFSNLLTYELLADIILYSEQADREAFKYFFCKYMRLIEVASHDIEASQFFNWLYQQCSNGCEHDNRQYYNLAGAGSVFLMFHELIHTDTTLRDEYARILFSPADIQELLNGQDSELEEEAICDFTSLALIANYNLEKHFSCTKEEFLKTSMLSLFLPSIYDLFISIEMNCSVCAAEPKAEPIAVLNSRLLILSALIKKAKLSGLFFEQYDLKAAMDYVGNTIEQFLWSIGTLLQSGFLTEYNSFNLLTDDEKRQYRIAQPENPWFLFT